MKKETIKITAKIFTDRFEAEFNKESLLYDFKFKNNTNACINKPTYTIREYIVIIMVQKYLELKMSKQKGYTVELSFSTAYHKSGN